MSALSPRRQPWMLAAAAVAILGVAGLAVTVPSWLSEGSRAGQAGGKAIPTSLAAVTSRSLSSQIRVNGTLGYSGSYTAVNHARGVITALPPVGEIISQGQSLYAVDGAPVMLLYGEIPAYRTLSLGMSGPDVSQLNANLAELGYGDLAESDTFTAGTAAALRQLQAELGLEQSGALPLGQAVFLPAAARVTTVTATLGAPIQPGAVILRATSTTPHVTVALEAARRSQVNVGDSVSVVLPDGKSTPGIVAAVGTVATVPTSAGARPTIPVEVTLTDPTAGGAADQATVYVQITTATVTDALVVPVTSLLAVSGVGYAVEVVEEGGTRKLVPVTLGLFDESNGLVQVTGSGLTAGQQVVVPGQ